MAPVGSDGKKLNRYARLKYYPDLLKRTRRAVMLMIPDYRMGFIPRIFSSLVVYNSYNFPILALVFFFLFSSYSSS